MPMNYKEELNKFFVDIFNKILSVEEAHLAQSSFNNLSVKEMHILEAVGITTNRNKTNTMSEIAKQIGITIGSLTTAVNVLINKGYIYREKSVDDKRIVRIFLTDIGIKAQIDHYEFHQEMIDGVLGGLAEDKLDVLVKSLNDLKLFFTKKYVK